MDKEKVVTELLQWLQTTAEKGGEFAQQQLPILAAEIVAWHFWSSIFCAIIWIVAMTPFWIIVFVCSRTDWKDSCGTPIVFPATVIASVCTLCFGLGSAVSGYEAVKAAVAPRVVILEYVRGVMK